MLKPSVRTILPALLVDPIVGLRLLESHLERSVKRRRPHQGLHITAGSNANMASVPAHSLALIRL